MSFVRKDIKNTSTFNTGGSPQPVSNPAFNIWTNLSNPNIDIWQVTDKWSVTVDANEDLIYKYNDVAKLTISSSGFTVGGLQMSALGTLPSTSGYNNGDIINVSGILYVLEA